MEELQRQLISIGSAIGIAILTAISAFIVSKIKGTKAKILEPLAKQFDEDLNNQYLLPILQNVFQTFVKDLKAKDLFTAEKAQEAIQMAYDSLLKILPKFLIGIAKKLFPNVESSLKEKIQLFYEKNKNIINQIVSQEEQL